MKKILLSAALLTTFFSAKAQLWEREEQSAYGLGSFQSRSIATYNNRVYVGGGYYNPDNARIVYSNTGNTGSFVEETNFTATSINTNSQYVQVMKTSTAGNFLFAGIYTYVDDPHVFRFDGTNWMDFGNVPYVRGDSSWYDGITAMGLFTTTGTNDSLYVAFAQSFNGYSNNMGTQIYRTSIYNISWEFVDSLPLANGNVKDFEVFNNKLFYCTDNYARVFSSATGMNYTAASDTGFYNTSAVLYINDLQVHAGELYAATTDNDSCEVWKTADGLNWTKCGARGLGGNNISDALNLMSHGGVLYVQGNYYGMPSLHSGNNNVAYNTGGNNPTIFTLSGPVYTNTGMEFSNDYNDAGSYPMVYFKNAIYGSGNNGSWQNSLYKGCWATPVTYTFASDTTCLFSQALAGSSSPGIGDHVWFIDTVHTPYTFADTLSYYFGSTGIHNIKLKLINGACVDSTMDSIFVNPQFFLDSIRPMNQTVCTGALATYTAYNTSGTPPYTYTWTDNATNVATGQMGTFVPVSSGSVQVNAKDKYGCTAGGSAFVSIMPSTDITGTVNYSSGAVTNGNVYLIKHGMFAAQWDTAQVAPIQTPTGQYTFTGINSGSYIIRAEGDTSAYPLLINTYFGNEYLWDSASFAVHGCALTDSFPITMIEIVPTTGPGSITGVVYEGPGFGLRLTQGPANPTPYTNIIPGVPVKVGKNPSGIIVGSTYTDNSGRYAFHNLPIDNYKIYTDIPGYPMDSTYAVSITGPGDSLVDLDYYVDSNVVYIVSTTSIKTISQNTASLKVFPNPSNGQIKIQIGDAKNLSGVVRLFDLSGRMVYSVKENNLAAKQTITLDLESIGLSSGTYFLDVAGSGEKIKIVLIKN